MWGNYACKYATFVCTLFCMVTRFLRKSTKRRISTSCEVGFITNRFEKKLNLLNNVYCRLIPNFTEIRRFGDKIRGHTNITSQLWVHFMHVVQIMHKKQIHSCLIMKQLKVPEARVTNNVWLTSFQPSLNITAKALGLGSHLSHLCHVYGSEWYRDQNVFLCPMKHCVRSQ
jgi:hypothetical protein